MSEITARYNEMPASDAELARDFSRNILIR